MVRAWNRSALLGTALFVGATLGCSSGSGPQPYACLDMGGHPSSIPEHRLISVARTFEQQGRMDKAKHIYVSVLRNNPEQEEAVRRLRVIARWEQQRQIGDPQTNDSPELVAKNTGTPGEREQAQDVSDAEEPQPEKPPTDPEEHDEVRLVQAEGLPVFPDRRSEEVQPCRPGRSVESAPAPASVDHRAEDHRAEDHRAEKVLQEIASVVWHLDAAADDSSSPQKAVGESSEIPAQEVLAAPSLQQWHDKKQIDGNQVETEEPAEEAILVPLVRDEPAAGRDEPRLAQDGTVVEDDEATVEDQGAEDIQKIAELLEQLDLSEPKERALAAEQLGRLESKAAAALPALKDALVGEQHVLVRVRVAEAVARIAPQDDEAVERLAESLSESDWRERWLAASVLADVVVSEEQSPAIVAGLIETLDDPEPRVRTMAALALGAFGPLAGEAVPALLDTLDEDETRDVREAATIALGCIAADRLPKDSSATMPPLN